MNQNSEVLALNSPRPYIYLCYLHPCYLYICHLYLCYLHICYRYSRYLYLHTFTFIASTTFVIFSRVVNPGGGGRNPKDFGQGSWGSRRGVVGEGVGGESKGVRGGGAECRGRDVVDGS